MPVLEIDATDPRVLGDPFGVYGEAREAGPLARLVVPGMRSLWVVTRHEGVRAMLGDPRFELRADSFQRPPLGPEVEPYLHTMAEKDGPEHTRLRRLVAPAFSARRAEAVRGRVERIVERLAAELPDPADLVADFARPLPMEVICELIGIPEADRADWRTHGAAVAAGFGAQFMAAIPAIIEGAKSAVARRRAEPADDVLSDLIQVNDDDRLTDTELVTLVWHLVLAGQTPTNLIANAVETLLAHPDQLALLRETPTLMPTAVEELTRWCSPQLLTTPRYTREPVDFFGTTIPADEPVTASIAAANHDPRAFPATLDITRPPAQHLAYAHGPHYCLGAPLARVQTELALSALLRHHPNLALAGTPHRTPDPGTWRLSTLPVTLG
ncbi:cytochrome P450 family protein [Actinokineospora fastidiosa]|uniref:cytochrome P450 family protein n=1 Tax=Actinokineospora fastidiosa TaxID=1816 RepID=UPI0016714A72|nr:cytochrome P450 [Actinokineospora fastidiosa]